MAENSLSPAFVRINYASGYGLHTMTVPSVPYILPDVGHVSGQFDLRGAELSTSAGDAVQDYVDLLKPFFHTSTTFIDYIIFTQEDEDAAPVPRFSDTIAEAGTNSSTSWRKAVQATATWRTEDFGLFKVVLLDVVSGNQFDPYSSAAAAGTPMVNLDAYVRADESWLSGRDGAQPGVFLGMTWTLNEKLRKAYRMN